MDDLSKELHSASLDHDNWTEAQREELIRFGEAATYLEATCLELAEKLETAHKWEVLESKAYNDLKREITTWETTYNRLMQENQRLLKIIFPCPRCHGIGKLDDAEPGDIYFRTWKCPDCNGFDVSAEKEKLLSPVQCNHDLVDPANDIIESNGYRVCVKCGAVFDPKDYGVKP